MGYFHTWLILSGWGILFGLFPGYANTGGILYEAVLVQKKKPARWMYEVFFIDAKHPGNELSGGSPRRNRKVGWYISIIYVAVILVGAHYFSWVGVTREIDILTIIVEETSFPVFLLLTWLLPVYFMKRYLKRLKPGDEVDRYTYYDHG